MGFFADSTWTGSGGHTPTIAKCGACGLFKGCASPKMKPTGDGRRRILFVGEAPGATEDARGEQLVGDAGQCLRSMLARIGTDLDDCTKTNAVICRPPSNKIEDLYIESCRPNLLNTIRDLKPRVIILLGHSAVKSLVGTEWGGEVGPMAKWAGWQIPSAMYGAWLCPTYHPSYVLREKEDPALVRIVTAHLRDAIALERRPVPRTDLAALRRSVEVIVDPRAFRARMRDLAGKEGVLAFDYEADSLKPERKDTQIYTAAFCLNGTDTFAGVVTPENHRALSAVLRSDRLLKVASNLKFEERWTRQKLGHGVAAWHWDTMLGAHYIDNRKGICSVKFQTYIYLGIGEYDEFAKPYLTDERPNGLNRIREAHVEDILTYNGIDAIVEYLVAEKQKELLGWPTPTLPPLTKL